MSEPVIDTPPQPPSLREQYVRTICASRGADPDAPITIVYPDGSQAEYNPAWTGYVDLTDQLLALHDA